MISPGMTLQTQFAVTAQHRPQFDRHVAGLPSRPRRLRKPRGNRNGLLGIFDVDDPVAGKELLGFRKHSVGDRFPFAAGAHEFGLTWAPQSFRGNKYPTVL